MVELAEAVQGTWPIGVSLAATMAAQGLWVGRRRSSLNEALHELRRPLQALVLAAPSEGTSRAPEVQSSLQMAATALARLEREINGEAPAPVREPFFVRPLLIAAVERSRSRAARAGASVKLRWLAREAMVEGDRAELAQAIDNLLVNAIEHGGPTILVEARCRRGRLRLAVVDRGRGPRPPAGVVYGGRGLRPVLGVDRGRGPRPASPRPSPIARIAGRRRRGHGLRIVRRIAADHGGSFRLRRGAASTEAAIELPLHGEVERR